MRLHAAFAALCVVVVVPTSPAAAWARRITLNDTGMTQCLDRRGDWSSNCVDSHQDAAGGRDVNFADPDDGVAGFSFRKVCRSGQMAGVGSCPADPALGSGPDDWGCTYDNVTQLTWEVKLDRGVHDYDRTYTNKGGKASDEPSDAAWLIDATNAEGLCGAANWRLPDALELHSIVYHGMGAPGSGGPFIDGTFFPHATERPTWTRTESAVDGHEAWYIEFNYGAVVAAKRIEHLSARLVHGARRVEASRPLGQAARAKDRFIPSADGTEVTDTLTGLVWRRCAVGMAWNSDAQTCDGTETHFSWKQALDHVSRTGRWRIPNIKELFSIVNPETHDPAIDPLAFPNTPTDEAFLSSTPVDYSRVVVHVVEFSRGVAYKDNADKDSSRSFPLRLVRRGRE